MAKKIFTDESLATLVDETKSYVDSAVSTKANSSHTHSISNVTNLQSSLDAKVPTSRTVNGKALSSNITLSASDVGAAASSHTHSSYVNQNAFSSVKVGSTTVSADTTTDTLELVAGSNITITPDATNDKVTIAATDTTYDAAGSSLGLVKSGGDVTISSGTITVNDDSHNHVISNVDGLQSALDAKQASVTGAASTITSSNLTANRALISDSSGKVAVSTITSTELGYLDNVSSNIQTQLDGKSSTSHSHSTATTSANGFMSASDKTKLDGIVDATQSKSGLMSAEDKTQLDYGGIPIVTTSGTGSAYTATVDGMTQLKVGARLTIIPHTVSTAFAPTLNINSLGAKSIRMPVSYNTSTTSNGVLESWLIANKPVTLQYNGSYWLTVDITRPSAQYLYGTVPVASGGTGATTAADALINLGLTATATELNYTDGVTSNIQTQLNGKAASSHTHALLNNSNGGQIGLLYEDSDNTLNYFKPHNPVSGHTYNLGSVNNPWDNAYVKNDVNIGGTNIKDSMSKLLITKSFTSASTSVDSGKEFAPNISIALNGYTPLGIVGYQTSGSGSTYANVKSVYLSGTTAIANIRNLGNSTYTWTFTVYVLYKLNL